MARAGGSVILDGAAEEFAQRRKRGWKTMSGIWKAAGLSVGLILAATWCASGQSTTAPYASKVGIELDGIGAGMRSRAFVDVAKTLRPWAHVDDKKPAPTDERGWPTCDASTVLFDVRPAFAWAPPIDDPDAYQPDWSGTYHLAFQGKADVATREEHRCRVEGLAYDEAANTTTGRVVVPQGVGLLVLAFTNTQRDAASPKGSGITHLRVVRPGYPADSKQVFTSEFLDSLKPFAVLRYMDWLETNHNPGFYGDAGHHALNWSDRRRPDDATQSRTGKIHGVAWEYVAELSNQSGKDLWINIPVAATDDYVLELARLLKASLKPGLKIYVEHSNEVWNFGFPQYIYNKLAAIDEVKQGRAPWNSDGSKDQEVWARRRHAGRLVEIAKTFREVFGDEARDRIRPIYASWVLQPKPSFADVLAWVKTQYGEPNALFYGIAGASYYGIRKAPKDASPEQLVEAMRVSSDDNLKNRGAIQAIAERYGLKHCQYEVGPDVGGGKTENVANRIRANRLPAMEQLMLHDALDNWFNRGGDLYMIFAHVSGYSRFGCWGLSEDVLQRDTPKWRAVYTLTGAAPPAK
jgi:hypothetical protein